ncbi:hypothetical protein PRIC1_005435 [Phytophthora ramorum]|uniref:K-box domain-containing protein n=1 Tax=Phytophthora ramorum TaxID=164328 RepID=H3GVX9_PHYRM|nr:hypothetical protein KRP23_9117 [Phytophthora ramorum]KAH7506784.1 hypothetical protein KRP22_4737 [Phytophthora ramorum]
MKRRPLRAVGSFGLYAFCICLSTIALQALTSPSPAPFLSRLSPVNSFLWRSEASEISSVDLRLRNLSVHRVRYVDEDAEEQEHAPDTKTSVRKALSDLLTASTTRAEVSSVVVTWEDHPLAVHARAKDARLEEEEEGDSEPVALDGGSESFSYEVQIWVTGWGLDGLWNPANRRVVTRDPFLVLVDLPREHEMGFRVRMKAKQTKRSLLGFLLPMGFFSTETDGPWSDVVTLSPTRDDELEAIVMYLASNKPLLLLLAVCIGSGCLVVAQLYFRRRLAVRRQRKLLQMQPSRRSSSEKDDAEVDAATSAEDSSKSVQELEHEIRDLRQELADSEDEVRQLMLFSGYGIDSLAPHELEQLERELKHTLKRIHHLKKNAPAPESGDLKPVDEQNRRERRRLKQRDALPMSPIYEHRSF